MCFPIAAIGVAMGATAGTTAATAIGLSTVMTVGGTLFSAYSSYKQGQYNKQVQKNNAIASEYQAKDSQRRGEIAEAQSRLKTSRLIGQQRSAIAANGVVVGSGTALDTVSDTAGLGEADALTVRHNAEMEAWGYRANASNSRAAGTLAGRAGTSNAVGSLLAGTGSVADKWYKASR